MLQAVHEQMEGRLKKLELRRVSAGHNCQLIPLTDLLPLVDDTEAFERELRALGVPAGDVRHPAVFSRLGRSRGIAVHELAFVSGLSALPVKVALPGPYLLTRTMWMECISDRAYANREALSADIVRVLREEIACLLAGGAALVQPNNGTADEGAALSGAYRPSVDTLSQMRVGTLMLELCTPRAGEMAARTASHRLSRRLARGHQWQIGRPADVLRQCPSRRNEPGTVCATGSAFATTQKATC